MNNAAPAASAASGIPKRDLAGKWDLLYISTSSGTVLVYRYWQLKIYATLKGFKTPKGLCVDKSSNVFVTDSALHEIVEYAHGASSPAATLSDSGYDPSACSFDPTTGNLAVANYQTAGSGAGNVAVYPSGGGKATFYKPNLDGKGPITCGYDDQGNLLIATEYAKKNNEYALFSLLVKGGKAFTQLTFPKISGSNFENVTNVQWDGKYWAITDNGNIMRYSISSGVATFESATSLYENWDGQTQVWLVNTTTNKNAEANQMVAAESSSVNYWKYPSGGNPYTYIAKLYEPYGVTVSLATL